MRYSGSITEIFIFNNNEEIVIPNVLHLLDLKTNMIILRKLDDQGLKTILSHGFLIIYDKFGKLLTKTKKTIGNIF